MKVFEGTINGEKFSNVEDYNKKMKELLNAGQDVDASSSTRITSDEEKCPCGCETCGSDCNQGGSDYTFMLPYLNNDCSVNADEISAIENLSEIEEGLRKLVRNNMDAIDEMSLAERSVLLDDFGKMKLEMAGYLKEQDEVIEELQNSLAEELTHRTVASKALGELKGYIEAMEEYVRNGAGSEDSVQADYTKNRDKISKDQTVSSMSKLLKELFGLTEEVQKEAKPEQKKDSDDIFSRLFGALLKD